MNPTRQRCQAHRRRKALARVRHQLRAIVPKWLRAWRRGQKLPRIKLPYEVRKHKVRLYREMMQ